MDDGALASLVVPPLLARATTAAAVMRMTVPWLLGKTGQTDQVIQWTDISELPEIQQDWVKVDISRQRGSSRDMRVKLSLLTLYLAIQCHMLSVIKLTSSQHKELKVGKQENVAK